jgi:hypothetical protein
VRVVIGLAFVIGAAIGVVVARGYTGDRWMTCVATPTARPDGLGWVYTTACHEGVP